MGAGADHPRLSNHDGVHAHPGDEAAYDVGGLAPVPWHGRQAAAELGAELGAHHARAVLAGGAVSTPFVPPPYPLLLGILDVHNVGN
eukprot:4148184-Pyramimonas_sp.AAC.1